MVSQANSVYRWSVAGRTVLAFFGGFIIASGSGSAIALLLDRIGLMPLVQGVHVMTLCGFLIWCGVAMWVFFAQGLRIIVSVVMGSGAIFTAITLLLRYA